MTTMTEVITTAEAPNPDTAHRIALEAVTACNARIASAVSVLGERRPSLDLARQVRVLRLQLSADRAALPDLEREEQRLRAIRDEAARRRAQERTADTRPHMRGIRARLATQLATAAAIAEEGMAAARANRARGAESDDGPAFRRAAKAITAAREYAQRIAGGAA